MARKRTAPETPEITETTEGKTKTVTYNGPSGQAVVGIGMLEPGKSYELPAELADGLVAGSQHWE